MSEIILQNITKKFSHVVALNNVSLSIRSGEFMVLLGPTGAGKTTTLRVIAGLEKQDEGEILFDGNNVNTHTPADRDIAFDATHALGGTNLVGPIYSAVGRTWQATADERARDMDLLVRQLGALAQDGVNFLRRLLA